MAILNYSTTIEASVTLNEIQIILVKHGARKISIDYDGDGVPANLTFTANFNNQTVFFSLPCRFEKVFKVMERQKVRPGLLTKEQALRVGWRILKDWIEAQMAIVETEIIDLPELFMPYIVTRGGDRLYDYMKSLEPNNSPLQLIISNLKD